MNNNKVIDAIAPAFTALMIEKIQNLKTGWSKPWVSMAQGCPRNLAGRYYNGGNLFMLLLLTEYKRYKTPIFLTYKQAQDEEINVKKGEKSFPVYFWYLYAIPKDQKDGKGMPYEKYARLSDEQKKGYDTVLKAQLACCGFAKAGYKGCEVDKVARDIIYGAGYEGCFGHGLGHAVGIEIHENPRYSPTCSDIIQSGMVMTIEPGIYLPGKFGVRIEDTTFVRPDGCEIVGKSPKELIVL